MGTLADELKTYYGLADRIANGEEVPDDELSHYGTKRHSGRYPWGSGEDPYQHSIDFLGRVKEMRQKGMKDTEIAEQLGLNSTELRTEIGLCNEERKLHQIKAANDMRADKKSTSEIARYFGVNESTVRGWFDQQERSRIGRAKETAEQIKKIVDEKGMVDISSGDVELGISKERLRQAVYLLESEGYNVYKGGIPQVTNPGQQTTQKVLCKPGVEHKEIYNYDKVGTLQEYHLEDGGTKLRKLEYPASMDSKRLMIRYAEDGGLENDGLIQIRPGVKDLSLDGSRYSQVRILVDGSHYLKGMCVYGDPKDFPDGTDVIFNTNKTKDKAKMDVLKKISLDDPNNPFGATIKPNGQNHYIDDDGKEKLGLINKKSEEGDWSDWSNSLPSQFLSKQNESLVKRQLKQALDDRKAELDEINAITNPTVRKHYLDSFADDCDSAAADLKAAALPGQKYHVIIPANTLKDNEVYAPNYENGTQLALIRYPHGGTFEIPIVTVNNKNKQCINMLGSDVGDALCINKTNADRLSGADFDGDTVMAIPTNGSNGIKIKNSDPLPGLVGFDAKERYHEHPGMTYMTKKQTGRQMGEISNLIADMTLQGASRPELERAVRHSMVVIDAAKHKLDYKQSEIDNDIASLKKKYQRHVNPETGEVRYGGASSLITRAKSPDRIAKRQGQGHVNVKGTAWYDPTKPEGALVYTTAKDAYYTKKKVNKRTGEVTEVPATRTISVNKMDNVTDARALLSEHPGKIELLYAGYANTLKSMANNARLQSYGTPGLKYSAQAAKEYAPEVFSLTSKLNTALKNAPKERQALRIANLEVNAVKATTDDKDAIRKASQRAIVNARATVGSASRKERNINITPREWEAISKGAVSNNVLTKIIANSDPDILRSYATPKTYTEITPAKKAKMFAMKNSGYHYTLAEIAKACGVSVSTVEQQLNPKADN